MQAFKIWCPEAESNHRHADFQSSALPTELSGRLAKQRVLLKWRVLNRDSFALSTLSALIFFVFRNIAIGFVII